MAGALALGPVELGLEPVILNTMLRRRRVALSTIVFVLGLIAFGYSNFSSIQIPVLNGSDQHHFKIGSSPFLPTGVYGFAFNMTGSTYNGNYRASYREFIDLLFANRLNYSRFWLNWGALTYPNSLDDWDKNILTPYKRTGPGVAIDGLPKLDLNQWNQDYFNELAAFIDYANSKNVVIQAVLLDCYHVGQYGAALGFLNFDFYNANNNINGVHFSNRLDWTNPGSAFWTLHQNFIMKVIDTIGGRPNIIWETCNENTDNPSFDTAAANLITSYELSKGFNKHLVIPRDVPGHLSVAGHRLPAPTNQEAFPNFRTNLLSQRNWGVPLISDNDCCSMDPPADTVRKKAWIATASGAYVDIFGGYFHDRNYRSSANARQILYYLSNLRNFIDSQSFNPSNMNSLASSVQLISPGKEFYTFGKLLSGAVNKLLVYLPSGGEVKILGLPTSYTVLEFNPRTRASRLVQLNNGSYRAIDGNDWVIYVSAR